MLAATSQSASTRIKDCDSSVSASSCSNDLLLVRYYTSRIQTHKTRPLCGSIAVTIDTHKNSKIQRLSEFFLMRIGACFATFAILSYTKIIDNNWYLRHLFSYFLLGIQWVSASYETTSFVGYLPISFTNKCFACSANDVGSACISIGIQASTSNYTVCQPLANLTYFQAIFIGY